MNQFNHTNRNQRGAYIVEFSFAIAIAMFLIFSVIETGRLLYTWSALNLMTQRGARVAAVCPLNDVRIAQIAIFSSSQNAGSTIIPGIDTENIKVSYYDETGTVSIAYEDIAYVNVSITGYAHQMLIPILSNENVANNLLAPSFSTTIPVESLGYDPSSESRICFA